MNTCTAAISKEHDVKWMPVPARYHNGEETIPAHERGFCWNCNEHFAR